TLLTESEVGDSDEERMKSKAADTLTLAPKKEELHIKDMGGESFVGNCTDLNLTGLAMEPNMLEMELSSFKAELNSFKAELSSQQEEISSQQEKTSSQQEELTSFKTQVRELNERVLTLRMSSEGYRKLRNRFLTSFKSRMLKIQSTMDSEIIQEGNNSAYRGDVLVDATLYISSEEGQEEQRNDTFTFKALYGLEPLLVSQIKRNETIEVLNAHATVISSTNKILPSKEYHELFAKFMELLKSSNYDESYLDGEDPSELANAYRSFRKCTDTRG
ncbi:hypothetical protein HOY82DRAFT_571598, partial [Tuber indicum]